MDARRAHRRGALLLLVLGVLTLFLLMGTMMLTLATRARTTAKAFAAVTVGQAARPLLARRQLEQAVLSLVRGGPEAKAAGMTECLLGDMYGPEPPLRGRVLTSRASGPLLEVGLQITGSAPRAADLCGRVLTFQPAPESGDAMMSMRILRASGTGTFACWLSRLQQDSKAVVPSVPCAALVNQPAFRAEAYDAYDPENEWLTEVRLQDGLVSQVPHPAFETNNVNVPAEFVGSQDVSAVLVRKGDVISVGQPIVSLRSAGGEVTDLVSPKAGKIRGINVTPGMRVKVGDTVVTLEASAQVDNDNDGVNDGVWLTDMFGSLPVPGGGYFKFDASYLVLDLDSRINVNAHGSRTSIDYPAADGWWTKAPDVPTGSGYGPADIDASLVFVDPLRNNAVQTDPPAASDRWRRLVGVAPVGTLTATTSTVGQRRPVPLVGSVSGRYGESAVSGTTGNDLLSRRSELLYGNNPLVDLKCVIKSQMEVGKGTGSAVPKMIYYCPDWSQSGYIDDPYEMRLDGEAARLGELRSGTAQADDPFTLAELEAVLRQFDTDAATLSPRLAVALDDASQRSRMLVTTDTWDTPGLTGPVATEIATYIANLRCDPMTVISPDVLAGLRFDLNRPFLSGTAEAAAKQDYCKHLYVLLAALGQPADKTTAQWVVNALDYRDPDSKFTRFEFDTDPVDGWGPNTAGWSGTNTVWGAERPEVVIAQTLADRTATSSGTTGELFVSLHRPWNAELVQKNNVTSPVDVLDPALALRTGSNTLDLAKKIGNDPIWRLRFDGDTKFVRFDPPQQNDAHPAFPANCTTFTSNDKAELPPDSYLVVRPKNASREGIRVDAGMQEFNITKGGTFQAEKWSGAGNDQPGSDTMIFLERLADPESPWNATTNPYVPVDQLGIKIVNRSGTDPNNWRSFFRDPPFWRDRPFSKVVNPPNITKLDADQTNWLPWPNRAFISHGELVLVPQGDAIAMLSGYDIPKNKQATNPYYFLPTVKLLDATIVPSRFAGSQATDNPASLAPVGMDKIPFNQLSRWREPGRVNLNTVVTNTNCADPQRNDIVWWAVMGPDAALSRDEFTAALPAKSLGELLTLMQGTAIYLDSAAAAGVKGNSWKKNRPYDLNPAAAYATAIRLANVATIRSHMFAVWVTLRVRDTSPGGITSYHRAFAIVDRSRPVAFAEGQDLNVRDTIRVLRFLD